MKISTEDLYKAFLESPEMFVLGNNYTTVGEKSAFLTLCLLNVFACGAVSLERTKGVPPEAVEKMRDIQQELLSLRNSFLNSMHKAFPLEYDRLKTTWETGLEKAVQTARQNGLNIYLDESSI